MRRLGAGFFFGFSCTPNCSQECFGFLLSNLHDALNQDWARVSKSSQTLLANDVFAQDGFSIVRRLFEALVASAQFRL